MKVRSMLIALLMCASPVCAQEFSADMVSTMKGKSMTAKIYTSQDKVRMDMAESTMIIRKDKNLSWVVMPSEKMYMEHPVNMSSAPKVSKSLEGEVERVSMGQETVNGYQTEKFKVTYTDNGKSVTAYQWIKDGVIPVKIEAEDGSWGMEYKNLQVGPQKDDLFEPPADYERMEMPDMGSMMQGLSGAANPHSGMDMTGPATDKVNDIDVGGMMKGLKGIMGK